MSEQESDKVLHGMTSDLQECKDYIEYLQKRVQIAGGTYLSKDEYLHGTDPEHLDPHEDN